MIFQVIGVQVWVQKLGIGKIKLINFRNGSYCTFELMPLDNLHKKKRDGYLHMEGKKKFKHIAHNNSVDNDKND